MKWTQRTPKHMWTCGMTVCETHKLPNDSDLTKLSPCNRILLQNLTVPQPVKKFPAFNTIWRFKTLFTRAHHLSQYWATLIHFTTSHPNSLDPFYIRLPSMPRYSKWSLSFRFPHQNSLHIPLKKTKLRGLSPQANYTDRAAAAGRRS